MSKVKENECQVTMYVKICFSDCELKMNVSYQQLAKRPLMSFYSHLLFNYYYVYLL